MVKRLASGPTFAYGKTKLAINEAESNLFRKQLELEARLQGECGLTDDYAEGACIFGEKTS